ncbi:MAG: MerR family transcriptional regulator [Sediminibacterium sp.]
MAEPLQQLDLFGMEATPPVHIAAPKQAKSIKQKKSLPQYRKPAYQTVSNSEQEIVEPLNEPPTAINVTPEDAALPSVSRTPMNYVNRNILHKRGRKAFADMDQEIDKINVPDANTLAKKLYYPIGEVAGWFNVNTSLIRYWEKEFKQLQPRKTRKGDRLFRAQDIEFLKQIYYLLREKKYSIDGAKTYLKNNKEKANKDLSLLTNLKDIRNFLVSLKASI